MDKDVLQKELTFKTTKSSGAGGQHVNKVASKVVLFFDVKNSNGLNDVEKERIYKNIGSRLTAEKVLILSSEDSRSQFQNKAKVVKRFLQFIEKALVVPKKRLPAKPSKASIKRVKDKKSQRGLLKQLRKKPSLD